MAERGGRHEEVDRQEQQQEPIRAFAYVSHGFRMASVNHGNCKRERERETDRLKMMSSVYMGLWDFSNRKEAGKHVMQL